MPTLEYEMSHSHSMPLVIRPSRSFVSQAESLDWLSEHRIALQQAIKQKGALLLRHFPIRGADGFNRALSALQLGNPLNYIGGDSPRDKVEGKIYTSTEAPPNLPIPLHQELSFLKHFPRYISFFCDIPPKTGGETPIADARQVYRRLDVGIRQNFEERGVRYLSHYYKTSTLMRWVNRMQRSHKSWMEVFETESMEEVEEKCRHQELQHEWMRGDWLKITQVRPATLSHPDTGETVWFNQAHLYDFNPRLLGQWRYWGARLFYARPHTRLHEVTYGDHSPIPRAHLYHIMDVLEATTVRFKWEQGDLLVLDNVLAMHGRSPFTGKRRILTAMHR